MLPDMSAIDQLLRVTDEFERASDVKRVTLSWRLFRDSKKIADLHSGTDIQVKRLEAAMRWLSVNWPDGGSWPAEVPRPHAQADEVAA